MARAQSVAVAVHSDTPMEDRLGTEGVLLRENCDHKTSSTQQKHKHVRLGSSQGSSPSRVRDGARASRTRRSQRTQRASASRVCRSRRRQQCRRPRASGASGLSVTVDALQTAACELQTRPTRVARMRCGGRTLATRAQQARLQRMTPRALDGERGSPTSQPARLRRRRRWLRLRHGDSRRGRRGSTSLLQQRIGSVSSSNMTCPCERHGLSTRDVQTLITCGLRHARCDTSEDLPR